MNILDRNKRGKKFASGLQNVSDISEIPINISDTSGSVISEVMNVGREGEIPRFVEKQKM